MLTHPLEQTIEALGLGEPTVVAQAQSILGSDVLWLELCGDHPVLSIGSAWKAALDAGKRSDEPGWLLVALKVQYAFRLDPERVQKALAEAGLNTWGTWREVNLRLGGQLYRLALLLSRRRNEIEDARAKVALGLAFDSWKVVEAADYSFDQRRRKDWRGKRGSAGLFLARRAEDPLQLLRQARIDLEVAHEAGDRSPQHYALLVEALHRLWELNRDVALLHRAFDLLREVSRMPGGDSAELLEALGQHLFLRGMLALKPSAAQRAGFDDDEDPGDEEPTTSVSARLRAADSALAGAVAVFDQALRKGRAGRGDSTVTRIARGTALGRRAHARRLMGIDAEALLRRALQDLRLGESHDAKFVAPYAATIRLQLARLGLRPGGDHDEAGRLAREGVEIWSDRRESDDPVIVDLRRVAAQARLQLATAHGERYAVLHALRDALSLPAGAREKLGAAAVAYAGRALLPPQPWPPYGPLALPSSGEPEQPERGVIRAAVDHLATLAERGTPEHRQFAASHGAALLALADTNGPVSTCDSAVVERVYALAKSAHLAVAGHSHPVVLIQVGRASMRLARCVQDDPERVALLYGEAIAAVESAVGLAGLAEADGSPVKEARPRRWRGGAEGPHIGVGSNASVSAVPAELAGDVDLGEPGEPPEGFSGHPAGSPDPGRLASLLGEAHLRLAALRRDAQRASIAATWLEASRSWGNDSPELLGLLADALYKRARPWRSSRSELEADLRQVLALKSEARTRQDANRENLSVSAAAATRLWMLTGAPSDYINAVDQAVGAAAVDPAWPWPLIQLAQLAEADDRLRAQVPVNPPAPALRPAALWEAVRDGRAQSLLERACTLAAESEEFGRQILGGISRTFIVADPHGLLSATLVLKPLDSGTAEKERQSLLRLQDWLRQHEAPDWMALSEPLAVIANPRDQRSSLLVTRHAGGRIFRSVLAEAGTEFDRSGAKAKNHLNRVVEYLALILAMRGKAPTKARSKWRTTTKRDMSARCRRLGFKEPEEWLASWLDAVPAELPLVGKRDAHADNWIVTDRGFIVALDLQATGWLPLTAEVAQLFEDTPALEVSEAGMATRRNFLRAHLDAVRAQAPQGLVDDMAAVDLDVAWSGYQAFSMLRALFLVDKFSDPTYGSSGSVAFSRSRAAHGRRLIDYLASEAVDMRLRELAGRAAHYLRHDDI
ncbi:MAG TPA: hypothetical protein VNQ77_03940 [Frankiaceae bacterium]|nr:hypothetical protein [Frankiaceae bacterium]